MDTLASLHYDLVRQQQALARETTASRIAYRNKIIAQIEAKIAALTPAPSYDVTTAEELATAIADKQSRILLAPGEYGSLTLDRKSGVNLIAPQGADFSYVKLTGSTDISFDGLTWGGMDAATHWKGQTCADLTLRRITATGRTYIADADRVVVEGGDFTGTCALTYSDVRGGSITGAYIHHANEDCLRLFGNTYGITVEDCRIEDVVRVNAQHPDLIQIAHGNSKVDCPHDLTIRHNWLTDDQNTGSNVGQGIFLGGPFAPHGFRNILIEENILAVPHPQGIYVIGGTADVVIRKNTLIPRADGARANIRATMNKYALTEKLSNAGVLIEQNICLNIMNDGSLPRATVRDNAMLPAGKGWAETFPGPGMALADFIPLPSAGIPDSYGATEWLRSKIAA